MRIRIFFVLLFIIVVNAGWAQQSPATFHEPVAYLGTIVDNQGMVDHKFTFTNNATDSLQVERVATSCGCTSSNWSTEEIVPGAKGFVEVQFNPYNRPGPFEKQLTVHFRNFTDSVTLKIKGFVKPGTESVEDAFPIAVGELRLKQNLLDLGTITKKKLFSKSFEVYNQGDQILIFADDMEGPNHITVTFEPYTLRPKSKGKIWVHYDVGAKNDLGFFQEDLAVFTYESKSARKDFTVTATLLDLPAGKTSKSPAVHFEDSEIDFGIKKQGDTVNVQFRLQNRGKSTLHLKKVFGNCNCIRVEPDKYQVDPGDSADIGVRFLTHDRLGNQEKTVTVFTDDPDMPVAILKLKGRLRGPRN